MKIVTVVGARPQFIKAAVGSRQIRKEHHEVLVHTGQHYETNMSDVFFKEMEIPKPDHNLGIAGGGHGDMTGRMLMALEELLIKEMPDALLVYGDTNSTMAAALAAVKLRIPVLHVEAGNRFGSLGSPEEVNRIVTDHISTLRFACVESSLKSLLSENLCGGSYLIGDPMYDAFVHYIRKTEEIPATDLIDIHGKVMTIPKEYYYMTCHRQENTNNQKTLQSILDAMETLDMPTVYPVHPRNRAQVTELQNQRGYRQICFIQPVGYLSSIHLVNHAKKVVTDSGGIQREAFFAGTQCVTVLDFIVWPETMVGNRNQLAKPEKNDVLKKLSEGQTVDSAYQPFGDGHAAEKMCKYIEEWRKANK